MNYFYICPRCANEHLIDVTVAKGQPVETSEIPKECPSCGETIGQESLLQDIDRFVEEQLND